jgi:hypothetical protein
VSELVVLEFVFWLSVDPTRGAGSGKVGGVFETSMHQPQLQWMAGEGSAFRRFLLDCSFRTSAMMSSTGRSAGHPDGSDCANIVALTITTAVARPICTDSL